MKNLKRAAALAVILCIFLSLLPAAHAAQALQYEVRDDGVWITGGEVSGELVIPATVEGQPVVGIGREAFGFNQEITSVRLPEGLRRIEDGAFSDCLGLQEPVVVPDSVEWIGWYAIPSGYVAGKRFSSAHRYCLLTGGIGLHATGTLEGYRSVYENGLTCWVHEGEAELICIENDLGPVLELPEKVGGYPLTSLGPYFTRRVLWTSRDDLRLRHVIVPGTVKVVQDNALTYSSFESIFLGEGVEYLGDGNLSVNFGGAVTLPRSLTGFGEHAFEGGNSYRLYAYSDSPAAAQAEAAGCTVTYRDGADGRLYGCYGGFDYRVRDGKAEIYGRTGRYASVVPGRIEEDPVTKIEILNFLSDWWMGDAFYIPPSVTEIVGTSSTHHQTVIYEPGSYAELWCRENRYPGQSVYTYEGVPFGDTPEDRWYYEAVCYVYHTGLMSGVSADRFSPNATTSRAMLVTVLWRLAGCPEASGPCPFGDVAAGRWYYAPVVWAAENGIVNGVSPDSFAPDAPVTREQIAAILLRYASLTGKDSGARADISDYTDAERVSRWAYEAMCWAKAEGILKGQLSGGDVWLNPRAGAKRSEIAEMLMRFATKE